MEPSPLFHQAADLLNNQKIDAREAIKVLVDQGATLIDARTAVRQVVAEQIAARRAANPPKPLPPVSRTSGIKPLWMIAGAVIFFYGIAVTFSGTGRISIGAIVGGAAIFAQGAIPNHWE